MFNFNRLPYARRIEFQDVNYRNPLTKGVVYLNNFLSTSSYDSVSKRRSRANGTDFKVGTLGPSINFNGTTDQHQLFETTVTVGSFVPLDACTFVFIKQKTDTTVRLSTIFGLNGTTDKIQLDVPDASGNIVFSFGTDALTITGESWGTSPDYFVMVTGPNSGRSVWRNGSFLGSNAATKRNGTNTTTCQLGYNGTGSSADFQNLYLFGIFAREWTESEIKSWFANPWQLFKTPYNDLFATTLGDFLTQSSTLTNSTTFYPSTISAGNVTLSQSSSATNNHSFYTQAIIPGSVSISQSSTIANQANFYVPIVNNGSFTLTQTGTTSNQNSFYPLTIEHVIPSNTKKIYLEYGKNNIYLSLPKTTIFSR